MYVQRVHWARNEPPLTFSNGTAMNILTSVATILSVFVAYYFGQKSRTRPLRSATYSKQIDVAYNLSEQINEWGDEVRDLYSEADRKTPIETKEQKGEVRRSQGRSIKVVGRAMEELQRSEMILPAAVVEELDEVVSARCIFRSS